MSAGWWTAFRRTHLHDYNPEATRLWLALATAGALALAYTGARLLQLTAIDAWQVLGWVAIAVVAGVFPIQIPRTKYSIVAGDVVIFLLLALHGAPAATLAAALEGLIAAIRSTARVSSRIASLASAATAMTIAGLLFETAEPWLQTQSLPPAAAHLAALALAASVYFVLSTTALMQIVYLKRGERLTPGEWIGSTSWVGALYLVAAALAGLLSLHAQQFGRSVAVVGIMVIGLSLALLRAHFRHRAAELDAQEARLAAAQLEAEQNQKRFHAAFTHASIGMAIVSAERVVLQVNDALCSLLGYDEARLVGHPFRTVLHPGDAALLDRHVASVVARRQDSFSIELRCVGSVRREIWVSLHCALFDDHATAGAGLIFQLHDITSRRRVEGQLLHVAYHDSLTDLANRNCFQERLTVAVERSRADRRYNFAMMYLDLDRFKIVNDSLGHPAGDELLKEVARRLNLAVRPNDLVARLGGDEFAILLEDIHHQDDVVALGHRLLRALEKPASINDTEVRPFASLGITFSDLGYREPDEIMRDADLAMYKAKGDGKGRLALFDASLHEQLGHKLQLESDLRRAIGDGQLSLVFQPIFELQPHRLIGFEALARWAHPVRGFVSPREFIALAEETGCIEGLTAWAIDEAVRQLAAWREQLRGFEDLAMHVNVSGKDLWGQDFVSHVRDVLQRHRVPPRLLTLEITESTLMEQHDLAHDALIGLRGLGIKLGIDDFGTGYSSLAYLSTLPFDCLKIDQSFVSGMHESDQNVEIVRTVVSLGRSLNKLVIAEGIETEDQLERLKQLGAACGQGYLMGVPLRPGEAVERLQDTANDATSASARLR